MFDHLVCCSSLTTFDTGGQRPQHPSEARLPLQEVEQDDEQGLEEEVRHLVRRREDHVPSEPARLHGERAREGNPSAVRHCQSAWSGAWGCAKVTSDQDELDFWFNNQLLILSGQCL